MSAFPVACRSEAEIPSIGAAGLASGLEIDFDTQSKSALVPALGDDDETLRKDVYSHLEYAGSEIIPALKANLDSSDSNKHVKYGVAGLLGNITDAKAVPVLCDALKNGNDRVVNIAIRALGKHENILAIKPLLDLYSSEKRFENYIDITLTKIIRARKNSSVAKLVALSSTDDKETYAFIVKLLKKQIPDSVIILGEFLTTDGLEKEVTNKINALMGAIE